MTTPRPAQLYTQKLFNKVPKRKCMCYFMPFSNCIFCGGFYIKENISRWITGILLTAILCTCNKHQMVLNRSIKMVIDILMYIVFGTKNNVHQHNYQIPILHVYGEYTLLPSKQHQNYSNYNFYYQIYSNYNFFYHIYTKIFTKTMAKSQEWRVPLL